MCVFGAGPHKHVVKVSVCVCVCVCVCMCVCVWGRTTQACSEGKRVCVCVCVFLGQDHTSM